MAGDLIESFSGVRGIWGKGLNKELALKYGLCFVRLLKQRLKRRPCLVVGRDTRASSKEIAEIFEYAFSSEARKIINVGVAPVPAVELAVRTYRADGGVMITASHSPEEFNGWKLLDKTGAIISPKFLSKVIRLKDQNRCLGTCSGCSCKSIKQRQGCRVVSRERDLKERYIDFAKKIIGRQGLAEIRQRRFGVVVDPNGGAVAPLIKKFLRSLGVEGFCLNMKLGEFKRGIEPNFESLNYLREIIRKQGADFAVGFDSDGDRVELVLGENCDFFIKHGPIVNGQYVLALLVDEVLSGLKRARGKVVVTNDCTSSLVKMAAERYRAKIKEVEIGEINVVSKMLKEQSPVGGEGSNGGIIFPPSRCRDGLLTLAILLRYLARRRKGLSEVLGELPDFFSAGTKLKCPAERQIAIRKGIKAELLKRGIKVQERGGKTGTVKALIEPSSFIFFRASKTEPGIFRVIADSPSLKMTEELLAKGVEIFKSVNESFAF